MIDIDPVLSNKTTATFEYYAHDALGEWGGIGAEILDLYGEVTKEQFNLISRNYHPVTAEKLTVRTKSKRRSGYDICFSVPKSLSIYLAETNDQKMKTIIKEAIIETLNEMEQQIGTRNRKLDQWSDRTTGNMVYALFRHDTTRPVKGSVDPHYHFHAFCFNATWDPKENRWKACQLETIMRGAPEHQRKYHDRLMSKLRSNGYRIRLTKTAFELSSISRDLIDKFSRRTKVIEESVKVNYALIEMRASSLVKYAGITFEKAMAKIKQLVTFETRELKSRAHPSQVQQQSQWRARMTPSERNDIWDAKSKQPKVDPVLARKRAIMAERIPTQERTR